MLLSTGVFVIIRQKVNHEKKSSEHHYTSYKSLFNNVMIMSRLIYYIMPIPQFTFLLLFAKALIYSIKSQ